DSVVVAGWLPAFGGPARISVLAIEREDARGIRVDVEQGNVSRRRAEFVGDDGFGAPGGIRGDDAFDGETAVFTRVRRPSGLVKPQRKHRSVAHDRRDDPGRVRGQSRVRHRGGPVPDDLVAVTGSELEPVDLVLAIEQQRVAVARDFRVLVAAAATGVAFNDLTRDLFLPIEAPNSLTRMVGEALAVWE